MGISKEQILTGVLVAMIFLSLYQTIQLKELGGKIIGDGVASAATGETYAEMMERMHGSGSSSSGSSAPAVSAPSDAGAGMVGGC